MQACYCYAIARTKIRPRQLIKMTVRLCLCTSPLPTIYALHFGKTHYPETSKTNHRRYQISRFLHLARAAIILGPFWKTWLGTWSPFVRMVGPFRDHFWIRLSPCVTVLGTLLGHFRNLLGPFMGPFGALLEPFGRLVCMCVQSRCVAQGNAWVRLAPCCVWAQLCAPGPMVQLCAPGPMAQLLNR
jgi:hypothetical protein